MAKKHRRPPTVFPVADRDLPKIHISREQHDELRAYVTQMSQEIVRDGPTWGRNIVAAEKDGWKLASSTLNSYLFTKSSSKRVNRNYEDYNYHQQQQPGRKERDKPSHQAMPNSPPPSTTQCFMGHSKVPYSLEDVMNTLYCENTQDVRMHYANIYGSACLDCCTLATLEGATLDDPFWYIGIRWLALKSPLKKLVSSRDFVFLEHTGTHVTHDGKRILYSVVQSINIRAYGGKDSYFGLTRGHVENSFVFWVDEKYSTPEKPVLNMSVKGRSCLNGSLPAWITQLYLKKFWAAAQKLDHDEGLQGPAVHITVSSGGISHMGGSGGAPLDMAVEWVPNEERSACYVCNKKFQLVRRPKHHCRSCGEVICSECTAYTQLNVGRRGSAPAVAVADRSNSAADVKDAGSWTTKTSRKRRTRKRGSDASANAYVTMGKVCLRCMDLKTIMHNNSTNWHNYRRESTDDTDVDTDITVAREWQSEFVSKFEELRTLTPERDSQRGVGTDGASSSKGDDKQSSSGNSSGEKELLTTGPHRESSLTSSEVRAIIEQHGDDEEEMKRENRVDDDDDDDTKPSAMAVVHGGYGGGAEDDDDDDDDDGDFVPPEELEYRPIVVAPAVTPDHLLLADHHHETDLLQRHGDHGVSMDSLSGFNPDHLFDLQNNIVSGGDSDDEDDDDDNDDDYGDDGSSVVLLEQRASSVQSEILFREHLVTTLSPPVSPLSSTEAASVVDDPQTTTTMLMDKKLSHKRMLWSPSNSPTNSATLSSASSWSRMHSQAGSRLSITDVRSAIANQTKILDEIKRELDADVPRDAITIVLVHQYCLLLAGVRRHGSAKRANVPLVGLCGIELLPNLYSCSSIRAPVRVIKLLPSSPVSKLVTSNLTPSSSCLPERLHGDGEAVAVAAHRKVPFGLRHSEQVWRCLAVGPSWPSNKCANTGSQQRVEASLQDLESHTRSSFSLSHCKLGVIAAWCIWRISESLGCTTFTAGGAGPCTNE
ncbi:Rrna-processing protein fcf2, partial [Globisporangium splendens]